MIVCAHCGTTANAGDRVCGVCGAALATGSAMPGSPEPAAVSAAPGSSGQTAPPPGAEPTPPATPASSPSAGYQLPAGVGLVRKAAQEAPQPAAAPAPRAGAVYGAPSYGAPSYGAPSYGAPSYGAPRYPAPPGAPAPAPAPAYQPYQPPAPAAPSPYAYQNPYLGQYPGAYPAQYGQYAYPGYYMPYAYPAPRPPRAKGEIYRLVLAWIVIAGGALSILVGLLMALAGFIELVGPMRSGLAVLDEDIAFIIGGIGGGTAALYFGITAVMKRPSVRFSLPPAWIFLVLTVLVLGTGVVLWNVAPSPGQIQLALPLVILSGALPALTILAFAAGRLGNPSTWRHTALALIHGATLAILLATILEAILTVVIVLVLEALGMNVSASAVQNLQPSSSGEALAVLLVLSVVAPLVEEGVKPLAAILLMPRLRGPAEAFLLGLTAGIGFDFVETLGYIGMGNADWISIALQRIGAGLLHGVGAGMGALGWYYLLRGKGVPRRWLLGFGGLLYAVVQHAIFNGSAFLQLVPGPITHVFSTPFYLGRLPLDGGTALFFGYYVVILGVLTYVTTRLGKAYRAKSPPAPPPQPAAAPAVPEPVAGGAR